MTGTYGRVVTGLQWIGRNLDLMNDEVTRIGDAEGRRWPPLSQFRGQRENV